MSGPCVRSPECCGPPGLPVVASHTLPILANGATMLAPCSKGPGPLPPSYANWPVSDWPIHRRPL